MISPICGKCRRRRTMRGQRRCRVCHAANMRATRPKYRELSDEARRKSNVRSYSHNLIARGAIRREPCRDCGSDKAEVHHPDYNDPRTVVWLCRRCHLGLHREEAFARLVRKHFG